MSKQPRWERRCLFCGMRFATRRSVARTCSGKCRIAWWRMPQSWREQRLVNSIMSPATRVYSENL